MVFIRDAISDLFVRIIPILVVLLLASSMIPIVNAHDPPPEPSGLIFSLSGNGADLELQRTPVEQATQGSRDMLAGSNVEIGTWSSEPLTSPLLIESVVGTLVMWAIPMGIVVGTGVQITVTIGIDGEAVQTGQSEIVILNEPLWSPVPWTSDSFSLQVESGQVIEVNVIARIDGVGGARFQWGDAQDTPSTLSLENWVMLSESSFNDDDNLAVLSGTFETPWNCTDVNEILLVTRGPVEDHDVLWSLAGENTSWSVQKEGCNAIAPLEGVEGIYLHRWTLMMSDGGSINTSGYFETHSEEDVEIIEPLYVNVLGGVMGIVLVGAFMTNEVSRGMFLTSHERFTRRVKGEGRSSLKPMASAGIWTATILTGLLTSLTIVVVLSIVLYATIWTLDDL